MGQENIELEDNEYNYIFMSNHINTLLIFFLLSNILKMRIKVTKISLNRSSVYFPEHSFCLI